MGTPEETGTLIIRGCMIQIIGFSEQEFLIDHQAKKSPEDVSNDNFIKIKHRYKKKKWTECIMNVSLTFYYQRT
jgi:hypothetical protein